MKHAPKIQPYLSPTYDEQGKIDGFTLSINHGEISFEIIDMTLKELVTFLEDITDQRDLLTEIRQDEGHIDFGKANDDAGVT